MLAVASPALSGPLFQFKVDFVPNVMANQVAVYDNYPMTTKGRDTMWPATR